jgi:hypothetical protein
MSRTLPPTGQRTLPPVDSGGVVYAIDSNLVQVGPEVVSTNITPGPPVWCLLSPQGVDMSALLSGTATDQSFRPSEYGTWTIYGDDGAGLVLISRQIVINPRLSQTPEYEYNGLIGE